MNHSGAPAPYGNRTIDDARREQYRLIQAHKAPRRMRLADDVSLLWESETTVDHQVAEMLWMEEDPESRAAIQAGYADIFPRPGRPTATLSIEVKEYGAIKQRLGFYAGLEHAFALTDGTHTVPATIVGDHGTPEATTAVTYLAFALPDGFDTAAARLRVEHPRLHLDTPVPDAAFEP